MRIRTCARTSKFKDKLSCTAFQRTSQTQFAQLDGRTDLPHGVQIATSINVKIVFLKNVAIHIL